MSETVLVKAEESRIHRLRWWTLLVLMFSVLVLSLSTNMLNVALPTIQSDLGATITQLQWIVNIQMMIAGSLVLTGGELGDRLGRTKVLQAGLAVFCLANLGAVISTTAIHLIISRAFMGVGAAMVQPCILAITTNVFPKEERGKAIGVWAGLNACGLALGPIIGGAIVQHLDWKWIFILNIAVTAVPFVLGWFLVPNSQGDRPHRLDLPGNALFLAGIASLIYGLNNAGSDGWSDPIVLGTILSSLAVLTLFVLWERRTPEPLLDMSLFRNLGFSSSLIAMSIYIIGLSGLMYLLMFYLQLVKGYTALQTGERCIPLAVGILLGAVISHRLVARLGTKWVASLGFLCTAIMLVLFVFLKTDSPFSQLGAELFFLGFFLGCITAPASTMLMESLPKAKAGIGAAMSWVVSFVGASIGVAALGSLLTSVYSSHFLKAAASIQGLPDALVHKASDSVGAAVGIAKSGQVPPDLASSLVGAARHSFMDGWQIVAIVLCALFAAGVAICLMFMPSRFQEGKSAAIGEARLKMVFGVRENEIQIGEGNRQGR